MYKHILVPLDGSHNSKQALEEAIGLAKKFNSKLSLLTVINTSNFYYSDGVTGMFPSMYDNQKKTANQILNDAKKYVDKLGILNEASIETGNSKNIIAHIYPDKHETDLIVIGKSGADALNRLLIGSTTAYVVRNATTKVLVVNAKD